MANENEANKDSAKGAERVSSAKFPSALERANQVSGLEPPRLELPLLPPPFPAELDALGVPPPDDISTYWSQLLRSKAYGAPRVFDLFTLLAITLAFALLFAFLRFIDPVIRDVMPQVVLSICSYILLIALAQILLFKGESPRIASVVAGPVAWLIVSFGLLMQNPTQLIWNRPELPGGLLCASPVGIFGGYLTGGMIAGVFYVADKIRVYWARMHPVEETEEASFWDQDSE